MQKLITSILLSCLILTALSCGSNDEDDENLTQLQQEREAPVPDGDGGVYVPSEDTFDTRIDSNLHAYGVKCLGGEPLTVDFRGRTVTYTCQRNQWLVTVDDGTRIPVSPFIANLRRSPVMTPSTIVFFYIRPSSPADAPTWEFVRKYWVRFDLNRDSQVLLRTRRN